MRINPLLPEKQRARYRLAGALILVLAAVIALPKLLHSPSRPDQGGEMEIWVAAPPAASGASSSAASAAPSSASFAKHAPSAEMSAQPKPAPQSHFAVQAGIFTREQDARAQLARLQKARLPAYLEREKLDHGHSRFLVRAGPFSDRKQAEAALKQLRAAGLATTRSKH
ncbi:Sporulation domain-containing protein (DedD) [Candidatus Glomeribacter gigasporarum BEG34]|uniref:Sporulation domain-containing protein (DedD) n=1 Tax=Candidatus Glomeribacter gigasporarum BEG34 TaxID=1070319 RepID=G2J7R1_9BURK|nr:SPOR domain-containing protein [Candidatus Glomeribacter gigasporarum]CCD28806.1 Sporulation domain-containing protein (DedD) [Candidatus Glomeribacter gigasporarum BEG34]